MPTEFFPLGVIAPNPFQPRQTIDPAGIADLAANILATRAAAPDTLGLLQTPRGRRHGDGVQLAFGHRRLAAFQLLASQGHTEYGQFPVDVADLTDADMAVTAWSENMARLDLNPMERVRYIHLIMDEFGWTQTETAKRLGVVFATLSNILRLLKLPADVQELLESGQLSQARALDIVSFVGRMDDDQINDMAKAGTKASDNKWQRTLNDAHAHTERGAEITVSVIEPAAAALANALQADNSAAWLILARSIDAKTDGVDSAYALAQLVIGRAVVRAARVHDARQRVNRLFEAAGLETPWNAAATARVTEFLAWKKKRARRSA